MRPKKAPASTVVSIGALSNSVNHQACSLYSYLRDTTLGTGRWPGQIKGGYYKGKAPGTVVYPPGAGSTNGSALLALGK